MRPCDGLPDELWYTAISFLDQPSQCVLTRIARKFRELVRAYLEILCRQSDLGKSLCRYRESAKYPPSLDEIVQSVNCCPEPGAVYDFNWTYKQLDCLDDVYPTDVGKPSLISGWVKVLFVSGIDVIFQAVEIRCQHARFGVARLPIPWFLRVAKIIRDDSTLEGANECWQDGMYMYIGA